MFKKTTMRKSCNKPSIKQQKMKYFECFLSPFRDVVGLFREPHEPALHLEAHVEGQQEVQTRGPARQGLGQGQQGGQHGSGGMSSRVPRVVKVHGVNLTSEKVTARDPDFRAEVSMMGFYVPHLLQCR